jgi:hypothetical protein
MLSYGINSILTTAVNNINCPVPTLKLSQESQYPELSAIFLRPSKQMLYLYLKIGCD